MSFLNLFEREVFQGETKKFSVRFMIEKTDAAGIAVLQQMWAHAEQMYVGMTGQAFVPEHCTSLSDGDKSQHANDHGHWLFKATDNEFPELYTVNGQRIQLAQRDAHPEFRAGNYCRAVITMWFSEQSKRVTFSIGMIQYAGEGEALGGARPSFASHVVQGAPAQVAGMPGAAPGAAPGMAPAPGVAQPGMAPQPGVAQPGVAQPGVAQPGVAQPGVAQPGVAQPGVAQPGVAQPGMAPQPDPAMAPQPGMAPGAAAPQPGQPGGLPF